MRMMDRDLDPTGPEHPTMLLARLGAAAEPEVAHVAEAHLALISLAVAEQHARPSVARASRRGSRRTMALLAAAAFVAVPSAAAATGELPAPAQRVAAAVAATVGLDLPRPSATAELPDAATRTRPAARAGQSAPPRAAARERAARDRAAATSSDRPGAAGSRGNRFGQVDAGPDRGRAGAAPGRAARTTGVEPVAPAARRSDPPRPPRGPATGVPPRERPSGPAPRAVTPVPAPAPAAEDTAGALPPQAGSGARAGRGRPAR